jgi:hypothetical protein
VGDEHGEDGCDLGPGPDHVGPDGEKPDRAPVTAVPKMRP